MRWAALFLLFLNALVMGVRWVEGQRQSSHLAMSIRGGDLPSLTLLRELVVTDTLRTRGWRSRLPLCLLLGPIEKESSARAVAGILAGHALVASVYTTSVQLAPEYWVYLAPFLDRSIALDELKDMQAKQVDSYLITQGELRNGISLGFFRNADTAQDLQLRRRKQGYEALIKEVARSKSEYWVLIDAPLNRDRRMLLDDVDFAAFSGLQQREILCKGVVAS